MKRNHKELHYTVTGPTAISDPVAEIWERAEAEDGRFQYLLAHTDDGVIWGIVQNGNLHLSSDAFPDISPPLLADTLWEARLFSPAAEWFLWRNEDGWQAREISDGQGEAGEAFTESLLLWGTDAEETKTPFTLVREADLGLRHAPPMQPAGRRTLRLVVQHYIDYDESCAAYIRLSRLVNLVNGGKK